MHRAQKQIQREAKRFNVICCGRRFGKDIFSIDTLIRTALDGYPCAWFQPTYKSLLEVWRTVKRVLKPITVVASEQDKRIELVTGGVIDFWSMDGDPEACRGRKYKRIVINEAAKCRHLQIGWEMAISQTLLDFLGDAFFPSTPRGRDYYHQLYELGNPDNPKRDPDWQSWQMPTSSNPLLGETEQGKKELARLEWVTPVTVWKQEYLAQFLDVAGRFFDEWEPERITTEYDEVTGKYYEQRGPWHVCDPFNTPKHWNYWGSVDYGTSVESPTFSFTLFTIDPYGTEYAIDEVYEASMLAPAQAVAVLECLERNGLASYPPNEDKEHCVWTLSPQLSIIAMDWANTFPPDDEHERLGKYPVEHYWERGLDIVVPAVKGRREGWAECKRLLHGYRIQKNKETGEEEAFPLFRAFKGRCSNLIRTIPLLIRSDIDPEDIAGGNARGGEKKQEDHPADGWRYGSMTRPEPSPMEAPVVVPKQHKRIHPGAPHQPATSGTRR